MWDKVKRMENCPACGRVGTVRIRDLNPKDRPGIESGHCSPCGFYKHPWDGTRGDYFPDATAEKARGSE